MALKTRANRTQFWLFSNASIAGPSLRIQLFPGHGLRSPQLSKPAYYGRSAGTQPEGDFFDSQPFHLGHKVINTSLLYAKVSQQKIHAEYSQALLHMNGQQIPKIMETKAGGAAASFSDIGASIAKSLDGCADPVKEKRLRVLRNRLAKLKMELLKDL